METTCGGSSMNNFECPRCGHCCQREWVGLTADEIWECNKAKSGSAVEFHICYEHQNVEDFAEAIEAKLKEKNHG
jgi:Fe-S-cluster containining protein